MRDNDTMQEANRGTDAPTRDRRQVSPLTVFGVGLLIVVLVGLGWVGWQYFGTTIVSKQQAGREVAALEDSWAHSATNTGGEPAAEPSPLGSADLGSAQWLVRIPALGGDWVWPVVAGVGAEDLKKGVGWYPATAQPGQVGNFALAGHRVTNGEPFRRLLDLRGGDAIIVETRESVLTYELVSAPAELTVQDTETWVLDPVPGHEDAQPTESLITLTTCEDLVQSPDRSVAFGKLISTETK